MANYLDNPFAVETRSKRYDARVAIVTGGARGLGRAIARRLGEEGASVVIADIDAAAAERTAQKLAAETGSRYLALNGDLTLPGVADAIAARTIEEFGRIDTLVNNAAALVRAKFIDFPEDLMQEAVQGSVWTLLRSSKAVLPQMVAQKYGRIVNIGGEAWRIGTPYHTLLGGIGKGGMVGFTATLAAEVVFDGITVNCLSPGAMASHLDGDPEAPASPRNPRWNPPEILEALGKLPVPGSFIGRIADLTEVAAAVAFFGSPEASYITGQHLGISGGLVLI
jgi:NAD(P)-dependent dehydrogenase (short-subunit alcohol dehydrogenase family)